jgi:hypothetical protein
MRQESASRSEAVKPLVYPVELAPFLGTPESNKDWRANDAARSLIRDFSRFMVCAVRNRRRICKAAGGRRWRRVFGLKPEELNNFAEIFSAIQRG